MVKRRWLLPLLSLLLAVAVVGPAAAQQAAHLSESVDPDNQLVLAMQPDFHIRYGCFYPITYRIEIPAGSAGLVAERRRSSLAAWDTLSEKHAGDLFNGIEAVRFDYAGDIAHMSAAFTGDSDSLMLQVLDSTGTAVNIVFDCIDTYYDDRRAIVTVSADDWCDHEDQRFCAALDLFRSYGLYVTGGIITAPTWTSAPTWSDIQSELDAGNLEVASHSRTHIPMPYPDPIGEVEGSADDIVSQLKLPPLFSFGGKQYVYVWIPPFGYYDSMSDSLVGDRGYLVPRLYYHLGDLSFSAWEQGPGHFGPIEATVEIGTPSWGGGSNDSSTMNASFDAAVISGGIYHLMWHPQAIWEELDAPYFTGHLAHISGRPDLWYGCLGQVYLYHLLEMENRSVLSTLTVPPVHGGTFGLRQNFPNPFRSGTTIRFEVAERARVSLEVFDIRGARVATLAEGATEPGQHVVTWEAAKVPSGTYFCRLEASPLARGGGMLTSTTKMLRVR